MLHQFRKLVLAGAVAALALGTITSAADAARWKKAAPIRGDSNRTPDKSQVGISDEGSAVVAWTEFPTVGNQTFPSRGRVRIAMRRSGKKFEKPLKMPEVGARLLDVSVGPDGTAAVLYNLVDAECNFLCDSPLRLAVRDAGGKFREPITVVDSAFGGQVEVDGKGVINVMWTTPEATDPRGLVAQRKPRGSFDDPVEVPGIGSIEGPTLAVNDRGDAIAAWVQTGRESHRARRLPKGRPDAGRGRASSEPHSTSRRRSPTTATPWSRGRSTARRALRTRTPGRGSSRPARSCRPTPGRCSTSRSTATATCSRWPPARRAASRRSRTS